MNKAVAYDYTFNYFGGDTYNGRTVAGANITLAIRCYKDGAEVKFDSAKGEPSISYSAAGKHIKERKEWLFSVFDVSIDRKAAAFKITRDLYKDNLFKLICGYDKIEYDIVGYSLDVVVGLLNDTNPSLAQKLPKEFQDLPACEPVEVTESVFREFISSHIDDFDISDNKRAQNMSVSFVD